MHEAAIRNIIAELNRTLEERESKGPESHTSGFYASQNPSDQPLSDDLSQIRLKLKYVLFDLEATRRENHYLRKMLEVHRKRQQGNSGAGQDDSGLIM